MDSISALESITSLEGLRFHTTLPWKDVLSGINSLRPTLTWCPVCLESKRSAGDIIYSPLLWALRAVTVCPAHNCRLESVCPHCGRAAKVLSSIRSGYCSKCHNWLGHYELDGQTGRIVSQDRDWDYRVWVAKTSGELLGAASILLLPPSRGRMRDSISQCIAHFRGDRANPLFSKHIRIADATIRNWQCWADRPTLDLLLRMCYRLNISPLRFVTADIGTQTFNLGNEIEKALKEAISLRGGSTLMEVAGELGYKITRPLTSRFPELSAEVSRIKREATHAAIELALTEAPAPSVKDVARRMGYKSERELRSDFPDLYRRISARQKECRKDQWRLTLLAALREYPPPSLNGICKRLKTSSS